jgi:Lrp/AsnC family transcriptional regulator, leucine-responsive regulatory protein
MSPLDDFDKALLRLLQQNNRLTTEELSKLVNLSQSAVQRRVSRLRETKMIEADVAIISPSAAGVGLTCIVDVALKEGNLRAMEKFKQEMLACEEVSQCYYVTGSYDFVLLVNTRDMSHFEQFQKKYLVENSNLKHFYTHVVMERIKMGFGVVLS